MFDPLKKIPEAMRPEYIDRLTRIIKSRTAVFCATSAGLFILALVLAVFTSTDDPGIAEIWITGSLVAGAAVIILISRWITTLVAAKVNSFFSVAFVLAVLIFLTLRHPAHFNYSPYILSLFFTAMMMPWFVRDVIVLSALHFAGFMIYCSTRDFEAIHIAASLFGDNPFVTGAVFLGFAAILCVVVRAKENQLDLDNFLLLKDVESRKAQMERDLEFASRVQNTLVPQSFESACADVFVSYKPMDSIGGDYANFHLVKEEHLIFFIGDVTGHGVPAALMVNRLHTEFDRLAASGMRPGPLLKELNNFIIKAFDGTSMFLTAFCGRVDFKTGRIQYSNYGHPPQYLFRLEGGGVTGLESLRTILGFDLGDEDQVYENSMEYKDGDMIFLFTDGILELKNKAGEEYGDQKLRRFIADHGGSEHKALHEKLMKELLSYGGGSFKDDVFMISIKCKSGAAIGS